MKRSILGKKTDYPSKYNPTLLFTVKRERFKTPFYGFDLWRAYELSWLDAQGKPHTGILELIYPSDTRHIIESKSLKLYLISLNYTKFNSTEEVRNTIQHDLEQALNPQWIKLKIFKEKDFVTQSDIHGSCLDNLDVEFACYKKNPELLICEAGHAEETVYSNLLRSTCPITGQPDWATVIIKYRGQTIDHASLLKYLISYRDHKGFSENCCEQIFVDICEKCKPEYLLVTARYTRRGGIDINPVRCSEKIEPENLENWRMVRQ